MPGHSRIVSKSECWGYYRSRMDRLRDKILAVDMAKRIHKDDERDVSTGDPYV